MSPGPDPYTDLKLPKVKLVDARVVRRANMRSLRELRPDPYPMKLEISESTYEALSNAGKIVLDLCKVV